MQPVNFNNFENHVLRLTHASGHTLGLVLLPSDSGVDDLNVLPFNSSISDHDMVSFVVISKNLFFLPNLSHSRNIRE